jgi:hypothetical protein
MRPGFAAGRSTPGERNIRNGAVTLMRGMIARRAEFVEGLEAETTSRNQHF